MALYHGINRNEVTHISPWFFRLVTQLTMLSREDVVNAFQLIFGRKPKSEKVIRAHQLKSFKELREVLFSSKEFANQINQFTFAHDEWLICEVENLLSNEKKLRFWINLYDRYVSKGIRSGNYEKTELEFMGHHLKEGDVFFDIGANLGWYSLHAASILGETGKVVSFEANPETFNFLQKNIGENTTDSHIEAIHTALWDGSSDELLLAHQAMPFNPGSSFVKGDFNLSQEKDGVVVPAMQLSSLKHQIPDFIKIDVEGAEYRVLSDYIDILKRTHPVILSELYPSQLRAVSGVKSVIYTQMFVDIGYQVEDIYGKILSNCVIENLDYNTPHTVVFRKK